MDSESSPPPPQRDRWWSRRGRADGSQAGKSANGGEGSMRNSFNVFGISGLWRLAGRLGWAGRAVFLMGCVWTLAGMAGWSRARGWWGGSVEGEELGGGLGGWDGLWSFILVGMLWSLGVAVAAVLPMWGYAIAGVWLGWYGMNLMGAWTGTPMVVLPVLWWLVVGWWVWWRDRKRGWDSACRMRLAGSADGEGSLAASGAAGGSAGSGSAAWERGFWNVEKAIFGIMVAWCGLLLAGPSGLNRIFGFEGEVHFVGVFVIGLPLGAGGIWAMKRWGTGRRLDSAGWLERVDFGKIWAGGVGVMGLGLGLSFGRSEGLARGWVESVGDMTGTWTGLLWFWLGCGFGLAVLVGFAEYGRNRLRPKVLERAKWILPATWLAVTAVEWIFAHSAGMGATAWMPSGFSQWWLGAGSLRARLIFEAHAWVGVVILVLGLGFLWQGRVTVRLLPRLHAVWITAFLGVWAGSDGLLKAFLESGAVGAGVLNGGGEGGAVLSDFSGGGGLIFILAGGLWWWGRRVVFERSVSGEGRVMGRLGALVLASGLVCFTGLPAGYGTGAGKCAEAALSGMLHFALPMILIWKWNRKSPVGAELGMGLQAGLGIAGLYMVLPWLERDPGGIAQLGLLPVEWTVALFLLKWQKPALSQTGGALAGVLLASAGVVGWMQPGLFFPEVPIFGGLNPPLHVVSADGGWGDRDFFGSAHFALLMLMAAAGAVLGALIFRRPDGPGGTLMPLLLRPIPPTVPPPA